MGGRGSGPKPDEGRRRKMARLRARGLTLEEIGRRLGVTRACVCHALRKMRDPTPPRPRSVPCSGCGEPIASPAAIPSDAGSALCLPCLAQTPDAPFGQRLKACRLAAGLSKADLAGRSGVPLGRLVAYEAGGIEPKWPTVAQLVRVLGPDLVTLGLVGGEE